LAEFESVESSLILARFCLFCGFCNTLLASDPNPDIVSFIDCLGVTDKTLFVVETGSLKLGCIRLFLAPLHSPCVIIIGIKL